MPKPRSKNLEKLPSVALSCSDTKGVIAEISRYMQMAWNASFISFNHPDIDRESDKPELFLRFSWTENGAIPRINEDKFRNEFARVLENVQGLDISYDLSAANRKICILVSYYGHAFLALLSEIADGKMNLDITGVLSNYKRHRGATEGYGITYQHQKCDSTEKVRDKADDQAVVDWIKSQNADAFVTARWTRIFSGEMLKNIPIQGINVHDGMVPEWKGGDPHKRIRDAGVLHVGATAHFLIEDLDEGPIIAMNGESTQSRDNEDRLRIKSRPWESSVLIEAMRKFADNKIVKRPNSTNGGIFVFD